MSANKPLNIINVTSWPWKHHVSVRLSPTPRVFLCAQGASNVSQSHDNAEYGLVNGIHRTAGITVGATELMWFDMDGAYRGNVDLSICSVDPSGIAIACPPDALSDPYQS